MTGQDRAGPRTRGRGARPWLILLKLLGLAGFFGGLAALGAMGIVGPRPRSLREWVVLREAMRAVFWPCVFGGLVLAVIAGVALWSRHRREFTRMRWFRVKLGLLAVCVPSLHLWARGRVTEFYRAIDEGHLERLGPLHDRVTAAWLVALAVMLVVAVIGRVKPRLGERLGSRGGAAMRGGGGR